MPESVIEVARRSLHELVGERWRAFGRAADLLWLGFGASRDVIDHSGESRQVSDYAVHVQCPWRVLDGDQLVTGSSDIYSDVQGVNRFDARAARLTAYLADKPVVVTSTQVTAWGDLTISFSDGLRIEALRTGSVRHEEWRFFRPYLEHDHVVVFEEPGES
ncbi:hypothetical protein [Lentzea terrae]|uniref:hypothetical protein n=1 Tax=Lentzea terrae TaxID=2200761 RepID=UPI000DD3FC64|nr:hypothetical protein [Lentzea terrae]